MTTVTASRMIASPVDRVWAVFTDIAAATTNLSGVTGIEVLSNQDFGPGFRWRETRRMFGQQATEEMWVTALEVNRFYEVSADSHGSAYFTRFDFTEVPGGTKVDFTFTGKPHNSVANLITTVTAPLFKRVTEKQLRKDLDDLAVVCERS